jgi:hypothetical protein
MLERTILDLTIVRNCARWSLTASTSDIRSVTRKLICEDKQSRKFDKFSVLSRKNRTFARLLERQVTRGCLSMAREKSVGPTLPLTQVQGWPPLGSQHISEAERRAGYFESAKVTCKGIVRAPVTGSAGQEQRNVRESGLKSAQHSP